MHDRPRILVAVDFSAASTRAVGRAIDLAVALDGEMTFVHAIEPFPYPTPLPAPVEVRSELRARLDDVVAAAQRKGVRARGMLAEGGAAWREILDAASHLHVDLVVLGTHGRRGFARVILGSTAEKVVRGAKVPVLTVPPYRFDDLAEAGDRLGRALIGRDLGDVAVIGVGHQGAVVGARVAKALRAPLDVLLLERIGTNGDVVGALAEGNRWLLRDDSHGTVTASAERLHGTIERASERLAKDAGAIRRDLPALDVAGKCVVLACARASDETEIEIAALSMRKAGATRVVAAIPIAHAAVIADLRRRVDDLVVLVTVEREAEIDEAYRLEAEPTAAAVRRTIHRSRPPPAKERAP